MGINYLIKDIRVPKFVVFWTISTIQGEKSAAKFYYIKTVSGKVVAQSIAFRVVSIYWQGSVPLISARKGTDAPLEARVPDTSPHSAAAAH